MNDDSDVEDLALLTLLRVAPEVAPDIPESLLKSLFAVQRRHQFDSDRSASLQVMQRLLEEYVSQKAEARTA